MPHLPLSMDSATSTDGARTGVRPFDEPGPELIDDIKAYLECRSRGVDPPPPLAAAWERFYRFYAPRIRGFLRRWALPEPDRNDCFQDVWQEVIGHLTWFGYDPARARLSTWMMTLARNKAVDVIRRRSRHPIESLEDRGESVATDPGPDPAASYERQLTQTLVRSVLDRLSSQVSRTSYQVLYLRWIEGRPTAEVAAALELSPGQVRFRTHRMKRKLRTMMEESLGADTGVDAAAPPRTECRRQARNRRARPARNT